ncbi:hypothetical protein GQ457_06G018220 [Hibiscus cannabinus]
MKNEWSNTFPEILIGHLFLDTTNTKFDVRSGLLIVEFNGEVFKFDVYKAMRHPDNVDNFNFIDVIGLSTEEFIETNCVSNPCREMEDSKEEEEAIKEFEKRIFTESNSHFLSLNTKILPSVLQAPNIELKPPSEHLSKRYTLSTIISKMKNIQKAQKAEEVFVATPVV